jgi:peptide/nickel transport system substrate-binding protein
VHQYPYDPKRRAPGRSRLSRQERRRRPGERRAVRVRPSAQGSDEGPRSPRSSRPRSRHRRQVEIRVIEWAALLKEYIKKRNFEATILAWGITPDPDQYDIWHSSKTSPDELNRIGYSNPEADELLEKGRSTCVEADRKKYYDRVQEVLADDQPIVFLYFRDGLPVVSSRVRGIVPAPIGINYNFNEWFVPLNLHRYTAG